MVELDEKEASLLEGAITEFGKCLIEVYGDKDAVKTFVEGKGFIVPSESVMDDEIYEVMVTLDWLRKEPQRIDEIDSTLLYGLLKVIESAIPTDASQMDPEFEPSFTLLVKGMKVIDFKKPEKLN